jgi:selenium-binding protein 1
MAMSAPKETYAYLSVVQSIDANKPDALLTIDLNLESPTYGTIIGRVTMKNVGDELHHFGWNACSSALCPSASHPHMERRYLIVPGLRSSNIYIFDTKSNPHEPQLIKTIDSKKILEKTGYSRLHTVHCAPSGILVNALGNAEGDGPGGIVILDHQNFNVLGKWEIERGSQYFSYDFWWHLTQDIMITSEWGTPKMFENGLVPELLLNNQYGHHIHIWNLPKRKHIKALDFGKENQMILELRPAHNPERIYGFTASVISTENLSASVWVWYQENNDWKIKKIIEIQAEPEDEKNLPPVLKPFKAVPPLITDICLSLDDKYLYVSCWGIGKLFQYDVSNPLEPKEVSHILLGGISKRYSHPKNPEKKLNGGPQMIESSLDGRRMYLTNSLYSTWDDQFYPDGLKGWMVKINVDDNGMQLEKNFFLDLEDERPHQVRLQGGDTSTDSYCYS